jgi:hypothetical protein
MMLEFKVRVGPRGSQVLAQLHGRRLDYGVRRALADKFLRTLKNTKSPSPLRRYGFRRQGYSSLPSRSHLIE